MSISFACPQCKAQIEVGEEHVGHAGQCPRCQKVIVIPSPNQPMPILVGADASPREDPKPRRRARWNLRRGRGVRLRSRSSPQRRFGRGSSASSAPW